jgi:hypothetical protein
VFALLAALAVADPLDSVVLIRLGAATCAGAVADGAVWTAYHCVARGGRPVVITRAGLRFRAPVTRVWRRGDVARLELPPDVAVEGLARAATPPEPGVDAIIAGHPLGGQPPGGFFAGTLRWSVAAGVVSAVGDRAIQTTAPANPGNSGGPLLVDGELVGVVSRRLKGQGLVFAGRTDDLDDGRSFGPLGGVFEATLGLSALDRVDGAVTVDGGLAAVVRDVAAVELGLSTPIGARWDTARFGASEWAEATLGAALGGRVGHGPWSTTARVRGGVASYVRLEADPIDAFDRTRITAVAPWGGVVVHTGGVGLSIDAFALPDHLAVRTSVRFDVPGVVGFW